MNESGRNITVRGDEKGQKFPPQTWSITVVDGETLRFGRTMLHLVFMWLERHWCFVKGCFVKYQSADFSGVSCLSVLDLVQN